MEITNRLICALRYILAFVCAEQLARCWTRSCCRWPRCWTRRQMNLRAPQETRYSLTPSLIYWSHYKHPLLLSKLWAFIFYFFPFILSLFFFFFFACCCCCGRGSITLYDAWLSIPLLSVFVVMALGAATVRQAGDELLVDEGAQLVWFPPSFARRCFFPRFSAFVVKNLSRPFGSSTPRDSRLLQLRLLFSPYSRCSRPSCVVTWRISSKNNSEK